MVDNENSDDEKFLQIPQKKNNLQIFKQPYNLKGLTKNNNNYNSYFQNKIINLNNETIFNLNNLKNKIIEINKKQSVNIDMTDSTIKFLSQSLETYILNIIQRLIEINRKNNYSYNFPFKKKKKKIFIQTYNINKKFIGPKNIKYEYNAKKLFTIFYPHDINENLNVLNRYNELKYLKKIKKKNNTNNKNEEDSDSEEENNEKLNYLVNNSSDITQNIKLKINHKNVITLKDYINYIENNDKTNFDKILLHKAYIMQFTP